ncbi:hypothetical protein IEQ34_008537 [Dendrobium chrysotoxum]|uniref:Uncharacterized protein n=1 Tax=Dendrobium chrysotoxum TaxID=161865 RepID=A0AAV7GWV1_DENCH|nr:hypothetical protein IEQ34_008537 [Dendrobium chrysotoxum]
MDTVTEDGLHGDYVLEHPESQYIYSCKDEGIKRLLPMWEKAEADVSALKKQLEVVLQKHSALEDRTKQLDAAPKGMC